MMKRHKILVLRILAPIAWLLFEGARAQASGSICEAEMIAAAKRHAMPLGVLYAVALTETGRRGALQPYAMNVEGRSVFSRDRAEALGKFAAEKERGARLIDIGCMQINHHFHGKMFRSVEHMFEPAANVDYGARFLKQLYASQGSWTMAVARYHAGPGNTPAQKRYVCAVIRNLLASGLGQTTPAAERFCR